MVALESADIKDSKSVPDTFPDQRSILDISGKSLELSLLEDANESVEELYLYKNTFNLIPKTLGRFARLKVLKYFANDINVFPSEYVNLVGLECLQLKISSPDLSELPLHDLMALKELDLSKSSPRSTTLSILGDIAGLKCLTKLSVCHFSIKYLPPDIGCLNKLEFLDLSFNKMRSLPVEISYLSALVSLKVASNKLVKLPLGLSSLQRLEHLDLSNNRLTSLGSLDPASMHNLQILNLQYNRLHGCCDIPPWIQCKLEGNYQDISGNDYANSLVEMDLFESSVEEVSESSSFNGPVNTSSNHLIGSQSNSGSSPSRRVGKELKQRFCLQQIARQERLNNSRKLKPEINTELQSRKADEKCEPCNIPRVSSEPRKDGISSCVSGQTDGSDHNNSGEAASKSTVSCDEKVEICSGIGEIETKNSSENSSYHVHGSRSIINKYDDYHLFVASSSDTFHEHDSSDISQIAAKSKRHSEKDLDNPKPSKFHRPMNDESNLSCKYNNLSFCSAKDRLPDGFYDAGRDRPYMPLKYLEQNVHLNSREVILLDRDKDEELDAIALSAQALVYHLKKQSNLNHDLEQENIGDLQIASLLALFVSDNFGGRDRSGIIENTRKSVSGSNYGKPFVCSCLTGNNNCSPGQHNLDYMEDVILSDLCEMSLQSIKARRNSIVVPLGLLHFGVCRHRALLMKYLCDRLEPPIPCELVRGYMDFSPHAWNVVFIKKSGIWVRMVVDACRPLDIRKETDPEYFCRYVPLRRIDTAFSIESNDALDCSFPSFSTHEKIGKTAFSSLLRCKLGSVEAVAKVRTLDACENAVEEFKSFEYSCLGEIRILGALKNHPCIVEILGHQISSKWVPEGDGNPKRRISQFLILMEYMKGGSLKSYIDGLSKSGANRVPGDVALYIARDVAHSLLELHSKHIIHRDIKSENVLIDLDEKRSDGSPVVKLCDFDRSVPLRSFLHTCCIAHVGIPPPDVCVGTPRWMAPEVMRTMLNPQPYGLEVDIWSFGCLVLELLTLEVPYAGLSESEIHELYEVGERPPIRDEVGLRGEMEEFLVDVFLQCTASNPCERPSAARLYEMLSDKVSSTAVQRQTDSH